MTPDDTPACSVCFGLCDNEPAQIGSVSLRGRLVCGECVEKLQRPRTPELWCVDREPKQWCDTRERAVDMIRALEMPPGTKILAVYREEP